MVAIAMAINRQLTNNEETRLAGKPQHQMETA
jgi:hypothetical protein